MNLNEMSSEIHAGNAARGFWDNERNIGELLMLVVSELSEGLEADRKNRKSDPGKYELEWLTGFEFKAKFEQTVKDTFEDEIADAMIRLLDMCHPLGIDIDFHIRMKLKYNSMRERLHGKKY
jgi:NTP pyrophosphatase (non-canonical NTP hydrolase)